MRVGACPSVGLLVSRVARKIFLLLFFFVVELRGGWCLLVAVYAPFTRPLRSAYARVRSVCAPCALRVRSVYAPCVLRVRSVCAPCALRVRSVCASVYIRVRSVYIRVRVRSVDMHQGFLRFTSGLPAVYSSWSPAVYTRLACMGCSWVWALAVITRGRLSLRVIARCCWFVVFVFFDCFRV